MGSVCSCKRDHYADENITRRGFSGRYFKFGSKWLESSLFLPAACCQFQQSHCPSLMEVCICKICEDIDKYRSFSMLPRDISQLIFNHLVDSCSLSDSCIEAFRDCALHDMCMREHMRVNNKWMDVISSQGSSLLSAYISSAEVTDFGLSLLRNCSNLQALGLDCCDKISSRGIKHIAGFTDLTYLSFRKCNGISAESMKSLSGSMKLVKLEFERCPLVHGGFIHLEGLTNLESLTIRNCKFITDSDLKPLAGLVNLKELQISCIDITNVGVSYLRDLYKLVVLNLEGSVVTASCLDYLTALTSLKSLNVNRCHLLDDGCEKFSALSSLKELNLGFNNITDTCLVQLKGMTKLEGLYLDSCRISNDGLAHLAGIRKHSLFPLPSFLCLALCCSVTHLLFLH
uniref:F-box-containing protein 1 n=1 Tax=Solanum tuberosum TaxID=4113 RepID=M1D0U5_SOLTU